MPLNLEAVVSRPRLNVLIPCLDIELTAAVSMLQPRFQFFESFASPYRSKFRYYIVSHISDIDHIFVNVLVALPGILEYRRGI